MTIASTARGRLIVSPDRLEVRTMLPARVVAREDIADAHQFRMLGAPGNPVLIALLGRDGSCLLRVAPGAAFWRSYVAADVLELGGIPIERHPYRKGARETERLAPGSTSWVERHYRTYSTLVLLGILLAFYALGALLEST